MTDTTALIERAKAMVSAMSPDERAAHFAEQRANWAKAESELSRLEAETTVVAPARHPFTPDEIHAAEIESAKDAVLIRLYDWIMAGASDAQTAFTASELRNVAREVEYRIHASREEGRRAGMMEAAQIARFYEVENFRLASDTILIDPILSGSDASAVDLSDDLQVQGCVHASMAHAAKNIARAIEAKAKEG